MTTVAIAGGAGGVGSSLAFSLLLRPEPFDVVVVDRRPETVLSHVMDLEQVPALPGVPDRRTPFGAEPATRRRSGGAPSDLPVFSAERIHEWELAPEELAALRRAADSVNRAAA